MAILGVVFVTVPSEAPLEKFYTYVPPLLLCYFAPSVFSTIAAGRAKQIDTRVGADTSAIDEVNGGWLSGQLMRIVAPE